MYLSGLVQRLRAHASFMRDFLDEQNQNTTLGLAAEMGVREVLRAVLPGRVGVISGFMCRADGSFVDRVQSDAVSPQTDVILYDSLHACPLYRMGDIGVVAGRDALGFIEVKDTDNGEYALRNQKQGKDKEGKDKEKKRGALLHVADLSGHAPDAFRAIVLIRAKDAVQKEPAKTAYDQCKGESLTSTTVPHVIYCADPGYVAVYEYISNQLHFFDYKENDATSALADFLRIVTGFFAARGIVSASASRGLSFNSDFDPRTAYCLQLNDRTPLPSLWKLVLEHEPMDEPEKEPSFEEVLRQFVELHVLDLYCIPTTGRNGTNVCAGIAIIASLKNHSAGSHVASFFALTDEGHLLCADTSRERSSEKPQGRPWIIPAFERPEAYVFRTCGILPRNSDPFHLESTVAGNAEREEA